MAAGGVQADGADRVAAGLGRAARDLADTEATDRAAGELVRRLARPPRRSGRLTRSAIVTDTPAGVTVGWTAVYAGVIHNGWAARNIRAQPWTRPTVGAAQTAVAGLYTTHAHDAARNVRS